MLQIPTVLLQDATQALGQLGLKVTRRFLEMQVERATREGPAQSTPGGAVASQ